MLKDIKNKKSAGISIEKQTRIKGFSVVELIIVLLIIVIMSAIALPYALNFRKAYKSEEQSLKIIDMISEANQLALNKRRTFRFEIDQATNTAMIIDENAPGTASDDRQIKSISLLPVNELRMDQAPFGIFSAGLPTYNAAAFNLDTIGHLSPSNNLVINNPVWAARFRSDGSAVDAGGVLVSGVLYVWEPLTPGNATARNNEAVRAITMFGGSGAVRYWKYDGSSFKPY